MPQGRFVILHSADALMIQQLTIGNVTLPNNLIQAPLAGYTDLAFRLLVREFGAGLTVSEMVAAEGVVRSGAKSLALAQTCPEERPFAVQIFGARPEAMAEAARILSDRPIDLIDINMGCPVPKVVRNGGGAALLKDPKEAGRLMRAVVAASRVPVTIKIRAGWDEQTRTALDVAGEAEEAGVAAITVHARTRAQGFSGRADWRIIAAAKEAVSIPVIGNGDVLSAEDARRMFEETGCDGIMIGRGAVGNPWVYREIIALSRAGARGSAPSPPSIIERRDVILRHLKLLAELRGDIHAARLFRKYVGGYTRGLPGSADLRARVNGARSCGEIVNLIQQYFDRTLQSVIAE